MGINITRDELSEMSKRAELGIDQVTRADRLLRSLIGYDPSIKAENFTRDLQTVAVTLFSEQEPATESEIADTSPLCTVEDFRRIMEGYLNASVTMALFSELTLLRAAGENPRVQVKKRGGSLRVSLVRSNGEVRHYNRDGKP